VSFHQRLGRRADGRADHVAHVVLVPGGEVGGPVAGKQAEHELGGLGGGQVTGVVAMHQFDIARQRGVAVARAARMREELGPLVVAVERQQRVVEIEQRDATGVEGRSAHDGFPAPAAGGGGSCATTVRSSAVVMGRLVASE